MDMNQYLEIFIEETKEHLQSLNQCLLQLEKNPEDMTVLNEIFRVAHTLKGMSGTMGFNRMSVLTHDMEDVLHALRKNEFKVNSALVDVLFKCLDALETYLDNVVNTSLEGDHEYTDIINTLRDIIKNKGISDKKPRQAGKAAQAAAKQAVKQSGGEAAAAAMTASAPAEVAVESVPEYAAAEVSGAASEPVRLQTKTVTITANEQIAVQKAIEGGMHVYAVSISLNRNCMLKSARAFIIFQALERLGEIIKSEPSAQDIEDEKFDFDFAVAIATKENGDAITKELNSISEVENIAVEPLNPASAEAGGTEETSDAEGEGERQSDAQKEEVSVSAAADEKTDAASAKPQAARAKTGKTVRVDIDRLDVLINLVGELIITKKRLEGIEGVEQSQRYNESIEYLERITTNLNDAVMKVRMVPVETVFNRFPRMIRDIARDLGKEIELTMIGEETELDRTVIDEIGDPLIHLLRNSADHAIESPEVRKQLGKPVTGNIYLRAYQDGNNVVIEVEDDGAGINLEKVKDKAVKEGLVNKDIVNNLSDKEVIDLLFRPSFSTADKITGLSGRGVGLDVVKTKIEALGGYVDVETYKGKGSRFVIRLPLTLAIIQALLVVIGREIYAIPLGSINLIENITPQDIKFVQKQEVIMLRNTIIPIIRLDRMLEVPRDNTEPAQLTVVIVKKGEKLSGFIVDDLIGQQEIVQKSLGKLLSGIKSIAGATILGDGNVALILDVNSLA